MNHDASDASDAFDIDPLEQQQQQDDEDNGFSTGDLDCEDSSRKGSQLLG
jgi:hypothetical protein